MTKILAVVLVQMVATFCGCGKTEAVRSPAIFAFGDSLVDSGNNNYIPHSVVRSNYTPYGETYFHHPTGRFTNGRHTFDFIANRLGIPFMPPFLRPGAKFFLGANFGSAGSGILTTTNLGGGLNSLPEQVQQFQEVAKGLKKDLGMTVANRILTQSLYVIISASNDMSVYFSNATLHQTVALSSFIQELISDLYAQIKILYAQGARKLFVMGLTPHGCSPLVLAEANSTTGDCIAARNDAAMAYNAALKELVYALNSTLPKIVCVMGKPFDTYYNLITNGTSKDFTEGSNACCGGGIYNAVIRCGTRNSSGKDISNKCHNVENFVFWDYEHPTERIYRILAKAFWEGDSSVIEPLNLKTIVNL